MERAIRRSIVSGKIRAPSSAPAAHRALIAASLAPGQSVLSGLPFSPDLMATVSACNSFGADIVVDWEKGVADVFGAEELSPPASLDCAESNSTLKLFLPLASLFESEVEFTGSGRLSPVPLAPHMAYLQRLGVSCESATGTLPVKIKGPISEREIVYFPQLGTQFFSGMLLSLPLLEAGAEIGIEGKFASREYVDITVSVMQSCGISFDFIEKDFISFEGGQEYLPLADYAIPSSGYLSSFLLLAGAIAGKVSLENTQGNPQFESLLQSFGANLKHSGDTIASSASHLVPAKLDALSLGNCLPHALVLASLAFGTTELSNAISLKGRQSKRLRLLLRELSKMGVKSEERDSSVFISGGKLSGADLQPEGDPASAMALSVAALAAEGPSRISGSECVEKSYSGFFSDLAKLGAIVR